MISKNNFLFSAEKKKWRGGKTSLFHEIGVGVLHLPDHKTGYTEEHVMVETLTWRMAVWNLIEVLKIYLMVIGV